MLQNVPHQIIQSPARLGLPNPNSPSLQTTTPPKFTSQSQIQQPQPPPLHPNLQTTPTSLTLLPLLPPLQRAQSILLRMSTLTTKLFEVSPNQTQWLTQFRGSFPQFLSTQSQSQSQSPSDSIPTSTKEIISLFTTLQSQLYESVTELQKILDLQDTKQKLTREIRSKDTAILSFANKLKESERVLDMLVDDYSDYRRLKRSKIDEDDESTTTVATRLNLKDILSYAHRISYTTFAPPEFGAGTAPLRGAMPPAPQEEQMRASMLYQFADLDVGLPKVDKERFTEPVLAVEAPVLADMLKTNIVVPSGWKPGMPVELPRDMPMLPPAGWKPGDPVALPPLDAVAVAAPAAEQQQPVHVPGFGKGPQPIQVRHVQLDIDDDSDTEYSSDDSSDDED